MSQKQPTVCPSREGMNRANGEQTQAYGIAADWRVPADDQGQPL